MVVDFASAMVLFGQDCDVEDYEPCYGCVHFSAKYLPAMEEMHACIGLSGCATFAEQAIHGLVRSYRYRVVGCALDLCAEAGFLLGVPGFSHVVADFWGAVLGCADVKLDFWDEVTVRDC